MTLYSRTRIGLRVEGDFSLALSGVSGYNSYRILTGGVDMETVRLSSKGQFVLPKAIRDLHHWGPGTELMILERDSEVIIRAARPFPETLLEPADASPVYSGTPLTIEDMDRAIAVEAGKQR